MIQPRTAEQSCAGWRLTKQKGLKATAHRANNDHPQVISDHVVAWVCASLRLLHLEGHGMVQVAIIGVFLPYCNIARILRHALHIFTS